MKHHLHGVWALMCAAALYGCPSDAAISAAGASANLCQSDSECASGVCGSTSRPGVCLDPDDERHDHDRDDRDDEGDESSRRDVCPCAADRDDDSDEHHAGKAEDRRKRGDDDDDCDEDEAQQPCSCPPVAGGPAAGSGGTGGAAGAPAVMPPQ